MNKSRWLFAVLALSGTLGSATVAQGTGLPQHKVARCGPGAEWIKGAVEYLRGGAPGAIEFSGTVAGNIATVQFSQPTLGVTGIFIWTLGADGNASGTFTSSIPNSGTSELVRLQ